MGCDEIIRADRARSEFLLLDTHTLVWLVFGDRRLGERTEALIQRGAENNRLLVSAITPWEVALLVSKKRIDLQRDVMEWIRAALVLPGLHLAPLDPEIAVASTRFPFEMHADPADRILVATARHLGASLVTADALLLDLAKKRHFSVFNAEK